MALEPQHQPRRRALGRPRARRAALARAGRDPPVRPRDRRAFEGRRGIERVRGRASAERWPAAGRRRLARGRGTVRPMSAHRAALAAAIRAPAAPPLSPALPLLRGRLADAPFPRPARPPRRLVVRGLGRLVHRWPATPGRTASRRASARSTCPASARSTLLHAHRDVPRGDGRARVRRALGAAHGRPRQAPLAGRPGPAPRPPDRAWAARHLGSPFGKTEAWILLDTPGRRGRAGLRGRSASARA